MADKKSLEYRNSEDTCKTKSRVSESSDARSDSPNKDSASDAKISTKARSSPNSSDEEIVPEPVSPPPPRRVAYGPLCKPDPAPRSEDASTRRGRGQSNAKMPNRHYRTDTFGKIVPDELEQHPEHIEHSDTSSGED